MPLGGEIIEQLQKAAIKIGTEEVMRYLVSQSPWMGYAVINPIIGLIVGFVLKVAVEKTSLGVKFMLIDHATAREANDFATAAEQNILAQVNGTPEQKKAAQDALIVAARKLIVIRP